MKKKPKGCIQWIGAVGENEQNLIHSCEILQTKIDRMAKYEDKLDQFIMEATANLETIINSHSSLDTGKIYGQKLQLTKNSTPIGISSSLEELEGAFKSALSEIKIDDDLQHRAFVTHNDIIRLYNHASTDQIFGIHAPVGASVEIPESEYLYKKMKIQDKINTKENYHDEPNVITKVRTYLLKFHYI